MWKNIVEPGITKATNTHSGCVILIAFPLQQRLHERTSVSRSTYIACFVLSFVYGHSYLCVWSQLPLCMFTAAFVYGHSCLCVWSQLPLCMVTATFAAKFSYFLCMYYPWLCFIIVIPQSIVWEVHSLFESHFSRECNLVLTLSRSCFFSFL
jgi:hypothetical protein